MNNILTRTLDELGRISIPSVLRSKLGWSERDILSLQCTDDNTLTLQLAEKHPGQKCIFYGEAFDTFKERDICRGCMDATKPSLKK